MTTENRTAPAWVWEVVEQALRESAHIQADSALQALRNPEDDARQDWNRYCHNFGLKPEHFGHTFTSQGRQFTVCEIRPRSFKRPVIAKSTRGTRYKFTPSAILGMGF